MKPYRALLILTAVLASATFAHAQSPSAASLEAIRAASQSQLPQIPNAFRSLPAGNGPYVIGLEIAKPISGRVELAGQVKLNPPGTCESCWFAQALQQGVTAFQRVCTMCASQVKAEPACGLCPLSNPVAGCAVGAVQQAKQPRQFRVEVRGDGVRVIQLTDGPIALQEGRGFRIYPAPGTLPSAPPLGCCVGEPMAPLSKILVRGQPRGTGSLMLGAGVNSDSGICTMAGCMEIARAQTPCCGIKDFIQFLCPAQVRAVNAPAPCCCAKACACCESCQAKSKKVAHVQPPTWTAPVAPHRQVVQVLPQSAKPMPLPGLIPAAGLHPALARLETPDFEAHCEKITHRGDTVILEGSVLLLVKKHAQPLRINAQRVIVNMKDGSYTVEHARQVHTSGFGILRTSGAEMPIDTPQFLRIFMADSARPCMPAADGCRDECEMPKQRIIQVVPVPSRAGQPAPLPTPPMPLPR